MTVLALLAAALAGLVHVGIFVLESVRWRQPTVWRAFGIADETAAETTRFLAFNQGFYNLFLAAGALTGVVCVAAGGVPVGWTLLVTACASMTGAAAVLRVSGGAFFTRAALLQATLPTIALVAALIHAVS